jgi:YidC/Oxa1 family membrane protein insertase
LSALAQPLGLLLKWIFDLIGDYGLSIIVFTVVVKLVMVPLTVKQMKSMKKMQEIQPKIKEVQEKYKNDKEQLNVKVMELYKEHKVSPFGGCLPLLIQFPIIIGLFAVLRKPELYGFSEEIVASGFLWVPNLSLADPWILPLLAGATTYLSSITMTSMSKGDPTQKIMTYFFPIMIFWWGRSFPAGLTLYWVVSNIFQAVQQLLIVKPYRKPKEGSN